MGLLDNLKFKFWDEVEAVTSLLEKWRPRNCKTEKDFEKSLYKYLNENLGNIQITPQYAQGRVRADLLIGKSVIVELKTDLNSTAKYQRLIGQLTEYSEWKGRIIILLTGQTDPNLRKQLDEYVTKQSSILEGALEGVGVLKTKITVFEK